jgi:hypothetical protein
MSRRKVAMKILMTALLAVSSAASVWAGLGGTLSNLGPGADSMASRKLSTGVAGYTEVRRTLDSGTEIREYLDASGTIFAVSWSGPFIPDLKAILGVHFDAMVAHAEKRSGAARSPMVVKGDDLMIVSGGHMGAFEGRAWLPSKLPAGFTPGDIQ